MMQTLRTHATTRNLIGALIVSAAGLAGTALAATENAPNFSNPGVGMSADAAIASGTCIAKYAVMLDDASKPAAEIGRRVADRCATLIARSAGMAALVSGKPDAFADDLKYMRDDLTTGAVVRLRAAGLSRR